VKTYAELYEAQRAASKRENLACMRTHALEMRKEIHPSNFIGERRFGKAVARAALYLNFAIQARDRARDMGPWAKGGAA
jgi:hypothetical protein